MILPDIEHGVVPRLQVGDHEEILVSAANEALNFLCIQKFAFGIEDQSFREVYC